MFKKGLFHSVFRVHSDFEICFFMWSLEIVQTVQFLKNWLLHKSWPKSQNFQKVPVLPNFSCRFHFWGLFLHSGIRNCSNSMILQLLALMWTLTKNQDVRAKLVLFKFSHWFWLWNLLICFGLGNHLCDPLPRNTKSVQKLSSQDQDLRFIHLVWIPSRLFSRLYQRFLSKYKWTLTSVSWTWNYTGSLIQPTILIRCLPVSNLPFSFGAYHSHLPFPATSLTKNS